MGCSQPPFACILHRTSATTFSDGGRKDAQSCRSATLGNPENLEGATRRAWVWREDPREIIYAIAFGFDPVTGNPTISPDVFASFVLQCEPDSMQALLELLSPDYFNAAVAPAWQCQRDRGVAGLTPGRIIQLFANS